MLDGIRINSYLFANWVELNEGTELFQIIVEQYTYFAGKDN